MWPLVPVFSLASVASVAFEDSAALVDSVASLLPLRGIYAASLWHICDLCVASAWPLYGLSVASRWPLCGILVASLWPASLWLLRGLSGRPFWLASGLPHLACFRLASLSCFSYVSGMPLWPLCSLWLASRASAASSVFCGTPPEFCSGLLVVMGTRGEGYVCTRCVYLPWFFGFWSQ